MKKGIILLLLFVSFNSFSQLDPKSFQKQKYELALSYYKKDDLKNALDLFSIASRLKPDNEIGKESAKIVDSLKTILRKRIMDRAVGNWKILGNKPAWAVSDNKREETYEEILEISSTKISQYEISKITKEKNLVKSQDLVFYNETESDALYSQVILENGTVWNCVFNENWTEMHTICVGKKINDKVEKITINNDELFFVKVN